MKTNKKPAETYQAVNCQGISARSNSNNKQHKVLTNQI